MTSKVRGHGDEVTWSIWQVCGQHTCQIDDLSWAKSPRNSQIVVYNVGCLYVFAGKQWWEAKTANNSVLLSSLSSCHHCRCNLASVVAGIMLSFMLSRYHLSLQFRKFNYSSAYSTDLISPWRQWHDWLLRYHSPLWLVSGDDAISGGDPVPLPVKVKVDLYSASSWEPHL